MTTHYSVRYIQIWRYTFCMTCHCEMPGLPIITVHTYVHSGPDYAIVDGDKISTFSETAISTHSE